MRSVIKLIKFFWWPITFFFIASHLKAAEPSVFDLVHAKLAVYETDEESGYTYRELQQCAVIVESNQVECDPDGDLKNGNYDAAN